MIRTFWPSAASAVPRFMAVVVLPTPPFWLARARIVGLDWPIYCSDFDDRRCRIGDASVKGIFEVPEEVRFVKFFLEAAGLGEVGRAIRGTMLPRIGQKICQRRQGARGDDVCWRQADGFDSLTVNGDVEGKFTLDGRKEGAFPAVALDKM